MYICRRWLCESPFPQDQPCAWFDFIIFDLENQCGANADIGYCGVDCTLNGVNYYTDPLVCQTNEPNCNMIMGGDGDDGDLQPPPPPHPPPDGYECGADIGGGCTCCNPTCNAIWDGLTLSWEWPPGCNPNWLDCEQNCLGKPCPKCAKDGTCSWQSGCQVYCDKDCPDGDDIDECEEICSIEFGDMCWECDVVGCENCCSKNCK